MSDKKTPQKKNESNQPEKKGKKTNPFRFYKEVRAEMKKITWPSKNETTVSTVAVLVMVFLAAVFLYLADQIIAWVISFILGF